MVVHGCQRLGAEIVVVPEPYSADRAAKYWNRVGAIEAARGVGESEGVTYKRARPLHSPGEDLQCMIVYVAHGFGNDRGDDDEHVQSLDCSVALRCIVNYPESNASSPYRLGQH